MAGKVRLWQRDLDILAEAKRCPMLTRQIADLQGFPSTKKAAERLCALQRAGFLKRIPHYYHAAKQGKPEFVYFSGAAPQARMLTHTIGIAEVRVRIACWLRTTDWSGDFYYTHEALTSGGVIPDATLILKKGEKNGLCFLEYDTGSETIIGNGAYTLARKFDRYAAYYDSDAYARDFAAEGTFRKFRVCLIVPTGRLPHVQRFIAQEEHDFVLITSSDRLSHGFGRAIWTTSENETVDLLGRRGELLGERVGEIVEPQLPSIIGHNACTVNDLRTTRESETTVLGQEEKEELT